MRRLGPGTPALFAALLLLGAVGRHAAAQGSAPATTTSSARSASDSVFQRARRLVSDGNGAAGRALVDSMLRAASEGTPAYGDALFWRGALSETAADAERDYRRVVVEYPLSPYSDDALLSLAELEQARGDRQAAYQHLQRFVREHLAGSARARAGLAAARLAFEQRDNVRGCAMIADARASATSGDIELRNQIEYFGSHCATSVPTASRSAPTAESARATSASPSKTSNDAKSAPTQVAKSSSVAKSASPLSSSSTTTSTRESSGSAEKTTDSKTVAAKTREAKTRELKSAESPVATAAIATDTPRARAPSANAPKANAPRTSTSPAVAGGMRGTWTIQLAAYNTKPEAERMIAKLKGRGVHARISGTAKPFRVRLDYYATRQAAAAAVAALRQRGIIGFVTEESRPGGVNGP